MRWASDGAMAVIIIKNRKTGESLKTSVAEDWWLKDFGLDQI
jgi:hypothetical protein